MEVIRKKRKTLSKRVHKQQLRGEKVQDLRKRLRRKSCFLKSTKKHKRKKGKAVMLNKVKAKVERKNKRGQDMQELLLVL